MLFGAPPSGPTFRPLKRTARNRPAEERPNLLFVTLRVPPLSLVRCKASLLERPRSIPGLTPILPCLTCESIGISGTLTPLKMPNGFPRPRRLGYTPRRNRKAILVLLVVQCLVLLRVTRPKASRPPFPFVTLLKATAPRPN